MAIAIISSNGRITLPQSLRERFNLRKGDKLDFRIEEDGTVSVRFMTKRATEVSGHFRNKATKARPVADIKSELRAAFHEGRM